MASTCPHVQRPPTIVPRAPWTPPAMRLPYLSSIISYSTERFPFHIPLPLSPFPLRRHVDRREARVYTNP